MKRIKKLASIALIIIMCMTPLTSYASIPNTYPTTLYIDFARISDGDSILLGKNGDYMLVDTGHIGDADYIINMLDERGVNKLKALVITHYHSDHMGAYLPIIDHLLTKGSAPIDKIYARKYTRRELQLFRDNDPETFRNYVKFLNGFIKCYNLNYTALTLDRNNPASVDSVVALSEQLYRDSRWVMPYYGSGNDFNYTSGVSVKWVNRQDSYIDSSRLDLLPDHTNNDSLLFKLTYLNQTMLFMGDASLTASNTIPDADKKSTILKVSHHGYSGYTSKAFLDKVQPTYSIVTTANTSRLATLTTNKPFGTLFYICRKKEQEHGIQSR